MSYDAFSGGGRLPDAALALVRTVVPGHADSDAADALEQTHARNPQAGGPDDPAFGDDTPGADRAAPRQSAPRVPVSALSDAKPAPLPSSAARALGAAANTFVSAEDPATANIVPELAPIVRQQLEAIENRHILWQGELWPGQSLSWRITDREADPRNPESGREWLTRVALRLPALGEKSVQQVFEARPLGDREEFGGDQIIGRVDVGRFASEFGELQTVGVQPTASGLKAGAGKIVRLTA